MTRPTTGKRRGATEKQTTKGGGRVFVGKGKTKFASHVSEASKRYLTRQNQDPFTDKALQEGYRSRAAYKLLGVHEKYRILDGLNRTDAAILDLGCAPGSWLEVLVRTCPKATIEGIDLLPVDELEGCTLHEGDIHDFAETLAETGTQYDLILSDMAMNTVGNSQLDALRTQGLADLAAHVALHHLKAGGHFATKLFQGGQEQAFAQDLRQNFTKVAFCKPPASRKESKEIFLVALGKKA